jgi:acetyl-CoA carboxylase biotin carboxyl carrier protein
MLKIQEIREIIKLVDKSTIGEFEYEHAGSKITLKKSTSVAQAPVTQVFENVAPVQATAPAQVQTAQVETAAPEPQQEKAKKEIDANLHKIVSPMVGTFYSASSPEADPYVQVGDKVSSNKVVCIVEAMKLFNEIEAEVKGEIVEVLVQNGELVEYGQPLFLVKPE